MIEEWTEEEKAILAHCAVRQDWIDTLPEPQRTLAIYGVPESEWPERVRWIEETAGLIRGTLVRVWHPKLGYWTTEKASR